MPSLFQFMSAYASEQHVTPNSQPSRVAAPVYHQASQRLSLHASCSERQSTYTCTAQFPTASYAKVIDHCCVQTIRDGKSIIIEGLHLDPGLYLYEFGKYGIRHLHSRSDSWLPSQASAKQGDAVLVEPVSPEPINPDAAVQQGAQLQPDSRYPCASGSRCTCLFINDTAVRHKI